MQAPALGISGDGGRTTRTTSGNPKERQVPHVPPPVATTPPDDKFYIKADNDTLHPNPPLLRDHFFREGRLTESQALFILQSATVLLSREPNLIHVQSPVTICGDIHGQYYDLMKLFDVGGTLQENCYLFLGDYVDRGCFGIECLLYLYSLKLCYPTKFVLLRGNHECRHLTEYFTFKTECLHKYSLAVWEACITSFQALPVAAVVDGRFFCVHGGISPSLMTLDDIGRLNRFEEPGSHGLLCDLLWADPIANFGHEQEPSSMGTLPPGTTFIHNGTRGCSYFYTYEAACQFLDRTGLLGIIRGHEAQDAGYTMHKKTPSKKFPSVITIFSAPNYLDVYHNRGAVIKYANKNITIRQYNASSHPYWLPNFMDGFTWSLPFVGAKIAEMLLAVLSVCSSEELVTEEEEEEEEQEEQVSEAELTERRQQIKNKILAVARMQRAFQTLREDAEAASELNLGGGDDSMPSGLFNNESLGVKQITRSIRTFDDARKSDMMNERIPELNMPNPPGAFHTPSMRYPSRRNSDDGSESGINMEYIIQKTLEETGETEVITALADRLTKSRRATGRPSVLKRHETA